MTRKTIYSILVILIVVGVYGYEFFIKENETSAIVKQGESPKPDTNQFYLPSSKSGQVVHHRGYSLSYSEAHEQAEWVAYEIKTLHLSNTNFKRPYFEVDTAIKTGAAHWRNYKNSGFDRGHLCPAGDRKYSQEAHDETFLTSNISPQRNDFNAGIWNTLEQKVRYWAQKYDGVFVVTGGVLKGKMQTIGDEKVAVPNQFYKIIFDTYQGKAKMIGFLMPHENSDLPLYEFVVTVDEIETLTGINFFPDLEEDLENKLEASSSYKDWSFN